MSITVNPADLSFFATLISAGSLGATSRELGITPAAVSKRLGMIEQRLNMTLVNRTTRRMSLTPEGEIYLDYARRILGEIDDMEHVLAGAASTPSGLLRINATLGFGRAHVAPLLSEFVKRYPRVEAQLQLSVNPPSGMDDAYDICFRFGLPPESRSIARFIAKNRRILCASPSYLKQHGEPKSPEELAGHNCIGIRQGDEAYGIWRFTEAKQKSAPAVSVQIRGNLTSNDGEIAVNWALDGQGVVMRSEWDVARHLQTGALVQILPGFATADADIYAVYPERHKSSLRVRALIEHVQSGLAKKFVSRA